MPTHTSRGSECVTHLTALAQLTGSSPSPSGSKRHRGAGRTDAGPFTLSRTTWPSFFATLVPWLHSTSWKRTSSRGKRWWQRQFPVSFLFQRRWMFLLRFCTLFLLRPTNSMPRGCINESDAWTSWSNFIDVIQQLVQARQIKWPSVFFHCLFVLKDAFV